MLRSRRTERIVGGVSLGLLVLLFAGSAVQLLVLDRMPVGVDYWLYRGAAERWLAGASFYQPWQLHGTYTIVGGSNGAVLYPPIVLILLVPFTYLPEALWWAIPILATVGGLAALRPRGWAWPLILILAANEWAIGIWYWGNPGMWILAAETLGFTVGWPAVLVLLKPTLAPFALTGARHRSWWVAVVLLALAALPFGSLWVDWWHAVTSAANGGIAYSVMYVPVSLIPVVAWMGRTATRAGGPSRVVSGATEPAIP